MDRRVLALGTLEPADAEDLALTLLGRWTRPAAATPRRSHASRGVTHSSSPNSCDTSRPIPASCIEGRGPMRWSLTRCSGRVFRACRRTPAPPGGRRRVGPAARAGGRVPGRPSGAGEQKALHLLRSGRLIRSTGPAEREEIETYHDRVREAVVAHVPPTALEGHHRSLARVLESSGRADPEVLAIHFHWSRQHEHAGMYYGQAAAQAAEALAFDRAAKLYRLALDLRPAEDAACTPAPSGARGCIGQRRSRPRGGEGIPRRGRRSHGRRDLRAQAARRHAVPDHRPPRRRTRAAQCGPESSRDDPSRHPSGAIASLVLNRIKIRLRGLRFRPRDPSQVSGDDLTRIEVCWTAANGLGMIDPIRASDFQARNLLLALRAGEPYRIGRAICMEASYVYSRAGAAKRRVSKLVRMAEEIAAAG